MGALVTSEPLESLELADMDDVELIQAVEQSFGVRFVDAETSNWFTVGDMESTLLARVGVSNDHGKCATSMSFYRLRAAIRELPGAPRDIRPTTLLKDLGQPNEKALLSSLSKTLGLDMPPGTTSVIGLLGLVMFFVGLPAVWVVLPAHRYLSLLAPFVSLALVRIDPGRFGRRTVGQLAKQVATNNVGRLVDLGADQRPQTLWRLLRELIGAQQDFPPDRISRDTRFYSVKS